ncbi:hypothetical protein ACFQ1L_31355 [Phytohabitans flavus]|uniref:hypothetical protein n=1 Tax=Phytohabitans flavus TaxID=1076124 RepID=UPI001566B502
MRPYVRQHAPFAPHQAALFAAELAEQVAALHAAGRRPLRLDSDVRVEVHEGRVRPVIMASEPEAGPHTRTDDVRALGGVLSDLLGAPPEPDGGLPPRPNGAPEALWSLLETAVAADPAARPTAALLARQLRDAARDLLLGVTPWPAAAGATNEALPASSLHEVPVPGYVPVPGAVDDLPAPRGPGRRLAIGLAAVATLVVLSSAGVVTARALSTEDPGTGIPSKNVAAPSPTPTTPARTAGPPSASPAPPQPGRPAASPAPAQPDKPQASSRQPAPTTPARPNTPQIASSTKSMNVAQNYGRAQGSVSWDGTSAQANGRLVDAAANESQSWLRIAYQIYEGGTWKTRYVQPDPYATVANGQGANFSWSRSGPIKDVQWDVCSKRNGTTYCTGWK